MQTEDVCVPNTLTYVAAVKALSSMAEKEQGKDIQGQSVKLVSLETGYSLHSECLRASEVLEPVLANTLIKFYADCGSIADAKLTFDGMSSHSVVSWTALILGYAENGDPSTGLEVFTRALASQEGNSRLFLAGVKSCALVAEGEQEKEVQGKVVKVVALEKGMAVHREIIHRSLETYTFVANSLIYMYGKCGDMLSARRVFDRLALARKRDVVSWTVLISGYAENSQGKEALELMERMKEEEKQLGRTRTFLLAALKACGSVGALERGRELHADVKSLNMEGDLSLATALVDLYAKCGSMSEAMEVFRKVTRKDVVVWNALLGGYSRQGETEMVFKLFNEMVESGKADGVTLVSVLVACAHAGVVDKGEEYFEEMERRYGVKRRLEHYHCMADMLGRAKQVERAVEVVRSMPFAATSVSWMIVLSACCKWKVVEVAEAVFKEMVELEREQPAARILMANLYGSVGLWRERAKVR